MLLTQFSFRVARKKPRNYRGRLSYVNLEAACSAFWIEYFANRDDLDISAAGQRPHTLFNSSLIPFISNNFGS